MTSEMAPDGTAQTHDVIVVGSGAAGLSAALSAALEGLSVLVIEQGRRFGGTTAVSGGVVWIPNSHYVQRLNLNYYLAKVGLADTMEKARAYLESTVGDRVPVERREAFLVNGPAMLREYHDRTRWMRFEHWPFPDYYAEALGGSSHGRALQPCTVDGGLLGDELRSLRKRAPAFDVWGLVVTPMDGFGLASGWKALRGPVSVLKVTARTAHARLTRTRVLAGGQALVTRLRLSLRELGVPMLLQTSLESLISEADEQGRPRVVGVIAIRGAETQVLRARRGVVLAAGGFARSQEMRERYLPHPTSSAWTAVPRLGQGGDGINAGIAVGAAIDLMDRTWGFQTVLLPYREGEEPQPYMALFERAKPGVIVVNSAGERYADESMPYEDFWNRMYEVRTDEAETVPSWMVFDQRARNNYPMFGVAPLLPFPRHWLRDGYMYKARSLRELAALTGLPGAALAATVRRYNRFAQDGHDDDFGRGDTAFARFLGDPRSPHPSLHPIGKAPFYAVRMYPGDLGTKGGLVVDEHSRVLHEDGSAIEGLYAAGNCSSSVMGEIYPGPGGTIGPAMVGGYIAGKTMARSGDGSACL